MTHPIRIVIAEDHPIVRSSLAYLLSSKDDFEVVGEAEDGEEAVEAAQRLRPQVLVTDYAMPKLNGVEVARRLASTCPSVAVVGYSWREDDDIVNAMRQAGAVDFVFKSADISILIEALRKAAAGGEPPWSGDASA